MQNIKSTLETEAIFSDDNQHRYLLKKTWDCDKEVLTIITMYPHYEGVINVDLTTQLIINKVAEKDEYGSVNFINLFSNIDTPINLKHINGHDKHTDIHIMKAVKEADSVLLAWGSYGKKPLVENRVNDVLDMLKPHSKKINILTNPQTNEIMHPLNPYARKDWTIKLLD
ncbi:DUF1643 domain-containing protein [Staphylococcus sp. HMSC065E08]|uniref:DUF1643 domain-containing protein n=1 Tax=Staphylococcus sp. HMSC065E08 TaxID=1739510 RepID=UPI0008A54071|nr:DUF1643 domain-containing protein [Staphylococcus sp. HMSC065E08]OFP02815.1 hypothetical protein HMPREF3007_08910 [Staphylococcus sp. HMSC065E08]